MPDFIDAIRRRLGPLQLPPWREAEIVDELAQHLHDRYAELLSAGGTETGAARNVLAELDGLELGERGVDRDALQPAVNHAQYDAEPFGSGATTMVASLAQDIRFALRGFRKNPGFTIVVVMTLALGIGTNAALFSVVNGVLLNSLPYPNPQELVTVHESKPNFNAGSISYPNFRDWQAQNHSFSALAVYRRYSFNLAGVGEPERLRAEFVSSEFFDLLGVRPVRGRLFAPREDEIGAAPLAVISSGLWKRIFSSAPDIVGRSLALDGRDYTIVGVVPESFNLSTPIFSVADVYVPIGQWTNPILGLRTAGLGVHGIGRLKSGVTIQQARADMERVTRDLAAAYPDANKGVGATLFPLRDEMLGGVRSSLLLLLGAVGFVLLIACVNVANISLARATARSREVAIRLALGASRRRIVRQLLTESVLLAGSGGAIGLLLAGWGTRAALSLLPGALPRMDEIRFGSPVLAFTIAVSVAAGILFGLIPALKSSRADAQGALQEGGRGSSAGRQRAHGAFVVVELALTLVLLVGAGLMIRTLAALWALDPGFDPRNVLTFGLSMPPAMSAASPDAIRASIRQLDDELAAIPGVTAASLSWGAFPMAGDDEQVFWMEGQPKPSSTNDMNWALTYIVSPGYLQAMRIRLERGRFFTEHDDEHAPLVAVVDEVFAQKYFGKDDPIGRRLNLDEYPQPAQIVGIVRHVRQWGLDKDDTQALRAQMYLSLVQMREKTGIATVPGGVSVIVRSEEVATSLFQTIRRALLARDGGRVLYSPRMMETIIATTLATRRFAMALLGAFAGVALLLSCLGVYGVLSYLVGQRTREIGVRIALGAKTGDIARLVIGRALTLTAAGVAIGIVAAVVMTRLISGLLFGVSATDPVTFVSVALLLVGVGLAASWAPVRRASRTDPLAALRAE